MSKKIELLRKIRELAERGVGGESINAQKQLDKLLLKYNLRIDDIEKEEMSYRFFVARGFEKKLLIQIAACAGIKTYASLTQKDVKKYGIKGNFVIECTNAEFVEIEYKFRVYKKLYKKEEDIFYTAFLKANDLLVKRKTNAIGDAVNDDSDYWERVSMMSMSINKAVINKQLG